MSEKGLIFFIKSKLDHKVKPHDIKKVLLRAGFSDAGIDEALLHIQQTNGGEYDELFGMNDYIPVLKQKENSTTKPVQERHPGLFNGRLRRKDFILGFLFFFGLGYVILSFSAFFVAMVSPALWNAILLAIQKDSFGLLTITIPVLLTPITVLMISMITRRLHDIGLPGSLSFFFLAFFVPSQGVSKYGLIALTVSLVVLFIILLSVRGHNTPNQFGSFPESRGSFFKRIFNQ